MIQIIYKWAPEHYMRLQYMLTHLGREHLNCLNTHSQGLNNLNQLLYCISLKIYNKLANWKFQEILTKYPNSINIRQQDHLEKFSMYCVIKCIVRGNQACFKNADLRHPSCTVVKTQICVTGPQCVKELHLCLSTVWLMCGFDCGKGSIHFCNGKIRAMFCLGNADSVL